MKTLKTFLFCIAFLTGTTAFAQKADSVNTQQDSTKSSKDSLKVPAKKADYFSKYKKPSSDNKPKVNDTWNGKKEEKKVESNYKYENGRVVGGQTSLKLGKKKQ